MSTGFEGGKTHAVVTLWHLAQNIGDPTVGTDLLPPAFDERDAFCCITNGGNDYFGTLCAPEAEFAPPVIARAYLDPIRSAIGNESCDDDTEEELRGVLRLPDVNSQPVPFRLLHSSAVLPSDVPWLRFPPILHPALAVHPLFKRRNWRRLRYTMACFLQRGKLQSAHEGTYSGSGCEATSAGSRPATVICAA